MPIDFDPNKTTEADDEKAAERKRDEAKMEIAKRQRLQPMRTFEAKLAEKANKELTDKESVAHEGQKFKNEKDEDESLLDRLIRSALDDGEAHTDSKNVLTPKRDETEKRDVAKRSSFHDQENDLDEASDRLEDKKAPKSASKEKSSSIAEEGYRRVAEKQDSGGGGAFGGGEQQGSGGDQHRGGHQGGSFGQGHGGQHAAELNKLAQQRGKVGAVSAGSSQRGFQDNARGFLPRDLDEIVSSVQVGVNSGGEDFFSVQLTDKYFDGLKVQAVRTPQGVVLKFECPNTAVRSTFLKYRPNLIARFLAKKVSVSRIDIL